MLESASPVNKPHGTPIRSTKYDSDSLTDEQCQPDEVPPTGTLPQDEGGEADDN